MLIDFEFFKKSSSVNNQAAETAGNNPQRCSGLKRDDPSRRNEAFTMYFPL